MKRKALLSNNILMLILLSLVCLAITKHFLFSDFSPNASTKSLVAHSLIQKINRIKLTQGDPPFSLTFKKTLSRWKVSVDDLHFYPIKDGKIEGLINELSIKRMLHKVDTKNEKPYGIGKPESYKLALLDSNGNAGMTAIFGDTDIAGTDIYMSVSDEKGILRTRNSFSDYLSVAASSWVDLSIFSRQLQKTQIEEIQYRKGSSLKNYRAPHDVEITGFSDVLESLTCLDITNIYLVPSETITITFGDTQTLKISLAAFRDIWILTNETEGLSYVISAEMKEKIGGALD